MIRCSLEVGRGTREPHPELRMPLVFVVSVTKPAWPARRPTDRIAVAIRWRLSVPAKNLLADAQQLESPVPGLIYVEDEYELPTPHTSGNQRETSDMDTLAAPAPLDLLMGLNFLVERKEIFDIGLRERHATVFNMLGARPADPSSNGPAMHDWREYWRAPSHETRKAP